MTPRSTRDSLFQRCEAVRTHVKSRLGQATFNVEGAKGERDSLGNEQNDDGFWRAVDVYVFGFQPPDPIAKPTPTPRGSRDFKIRVTTGHSLSTPGIDGPQEDAYRFEIVDVARRLSALFNYEGRGLGLPNFTPLFFP